MDSPLVELAPVREWLQEHGHEIRAIPDLGGSSLTAEVLMHDGTIRMMYLDWEFLRGFSAQQIKGHLESGDYARRLAHGDVHITRPAWIKR